MILRIQICQHQFSETSCTALFVPVLRVRLQRDTMDKCSGYWSNALRRNFLNYVTSKARATFDCFPIWSNILGRIVDFLCAMLNRILDLTSFRISILPCILFLFSFFLFNYLFLSSLGIFLYSAEYRCLEHVQALEQGATGFHMGFGCSKYKSTCT